MKASRTKAAEGTVGMTSEVFAVAFAAESEVLLDSELGITSNLLY